MTSENTFLWLTRDQQFAVIGVVGALLVVAGLLGSSGVDPEYDPLVFGIGVVMMLYVTVAFLWRLGRSILASE